MQFSLRDMATAFASIRAARERGQVEGQLHQQQVEARELDNFAQLVSLDRMLRSDRDARQRQRLEMMGQALQNPGISDEDAANLGPEWMRGIRDFGMGEAPSPIMASPMAQRLARRFGYTPGGMGGGPGPAPAMSDPVQRGPAGGRPGPAPDIAFLEPPGGPPAAPGQRDWMPPMADTPAAGQPAAPAPGQRAPGGGGFASPRTLAAERQLNQSLATLEEQANEEGDADTAEQAASLRLQLTRRQISAEDALRRYGALQRNAQVGKQYGTHFRAEIERLHKSFATGQIKDPKHRAEADAILGAAAELGPLNTPEKRRASEALMARYRKLRESGAFGPSAQDEALLAQRELAIVHGVTGQFDRTMSALAKAKGATPEWVLAHIQNLRRYSADPRVREYYPEGLPVPEDLDLTPRKVTRRMVTERTTGGAASERDFLTGDGLTTTRQFEDVEVTETEPEAKARVLAAAARYVEDPKERKQMLRLALNQVMGVIKGDEFKSMQDPKNPEHAKQRQSILALANDLWDELELPGNLPKDLVMGLTPNERALNQDRAERREIDRKRLAITRANVQAMREYRSRLLALEEQAGGRRGGRDPAEDRRFQVLHSELKGLLDKWDSYTSDAGIYSPEVMGDDKALQAEAEKVLGPLRAEIERVRHQMEPLLSEKGSRTTRFRFQKPGGGTASVTRDELKAALMKRLRKQNPKATPTQIEDEAERIIRSKEGASKEGASAP